MLWQNKRKGYIIILRKNWGIIMKKEFMEALELSPVIAAIKDETGLEKCISCDSQVVFVLYGDITTIPEIVIKIKEAGKLAMVHIDLIAGLGSKEIAVDFIKSNTLADGIITTKPNLVKRADELGLYTVLRLFLIDSMAFDNLDRQVKMAKPDVIEILPGLMPKIVTKVCSRSSIPVIASGFISDKEDVISVLRAGATCVSSTNENIWYA